MIKSIFGTLPLFDETSILVLLRVFDWKRQLAIALLRQLYNSVAYSVILWQNISGLSRTQMMGIIVIYCVAGKTEKRIIESGKQQTKTVGLMDNGFKIFVVVFLKKVLQV